MKMISFFHKYRISLLVSLIFMMYTLISFGIYESRTLNGNIDNHILAGDMFGMPDEIKAHGIKPLYYGEGQSGWDGQFHYYISNDILGLKDTEKYIDSPSYRYQRVGLPLYVAMVSALSGNSWVSPTTFFMSYFCLILAATVVGSRLLARFGANPALILLWSLSVGTQITLFNALPDAASDAFLILALGLIFSGRIGWSVIPFAFSALSREVYLLFPSFILLSYFLKDIRANGQLNRDVRWIFTWKSYYWLLLPGAIAIFWNIYVTNHFGVPPASQAHGILGGPLVAWYDYLLSGLSGNHKLVGQNIYAYAEGGALIIFLFVLIVSIWTVWRLLRNKYQSISPEMSGVALASGCLVILYACFGPVVMMHYSGYLKALASFYFLTPLLLTEVSVGRIVKYLIYSFLFVSLIFTTAYNMKNRILTFGPGDEQIVRMSEVSNKPRIECFGVYDAEIKINSIVFNKTSVVSNLLGSGLKIVVDLDLTNTGEMPFWSTRRFGSVFMSYHWVDSKGRVIQDGLRSAIPDGLLPGQTKRVSVVSHVPKNNTDGELTLMLSPVQEGCSWFYLANPKASNEIKIQMK